MNKRFNLKDFIQKNSMSKKMAAYQNELITRHLGEVENIYREMRGWRHDYHNHMQVIKAYLASGQLDALQAYCDQLERDLQTVDNVVKSGHVMLDAVLNSKLSLAKHREIQTHIKASVPKALTMTDIDLCVLVGNLLDNAMEACAQPPTGEWEFDRPFIRVFIAMKGFHLYICVTNTFYGTPRRVGGRFVTTKTGGTHGFGLARIDKICARYGGYCNRNGEPGAFSTEILLPVGT